jgi:hypothetical protein
MEEGLLPNTLQPFSHRYLSPSNWEKIAGELYLPELLPLVRKSSLSAKT